jgi:hypothetical protein
MNELQVRLIDHGVSLDETLDFLDNLRESGVTNMFGAAPYIQETYDIDRKLSQDILGYWMKTFTDRHPS